MSSIGVVWRQRNNQFKQADVILQQGEEEGSPSKSKPRRAHKISIKTWKRMVLFILAILTGIYSSSIILMEINNNKTHELITLGDKPIVDKPVIVDKEDDPSISSSDEYAVGKRMFRLVDRTIHQHSTNNNTSYLNLAIESCDKEYDNNKEYPTIYKELATKRRTRWKRAEAEVNIIQMINDKLGGLYYATKLGVRTPQILFCGVAEDLPKDINTLGKKYVVKPLSGHSAQGVKVIVDGINAMNNHDNDEEFSYNTLVEEYGSQEETIVEELIESADQTYNGLIPPDYKFHVYGGVPEIMFRVDRNKGQKCADHFDVTSSNNKWKVIEGLPRSDHEPHCPENTLYSNISRETAMMDAVRKVASNASKNWLRIDMYDSKNGPVFGEITPWSNNGQASPKASCVMSYLFTAHAYKNEGLDDAATVNEVKKKFGLDTINISDDVDNEFYPPEAHQWRSFTQMAKCNKVMKAQEEWLKSNG